MLKQILKYGLLVWLASVIITFIEAQFALGTAAIMILFYVFTILLFGGGLMLIFRAPNVPAGPIRGIFAALGLIAVTLLLDIAVLVLFFGLPFDFFMNLNYLIGFVIILILGAVAGSLNLSRSSRYKPEGLL